MRVLLPIFRIVGNPYGRPLHIADSLDYLDRFDRRDRVGVERHRGFLIDGRAQMDRIAGEQILAIRKIDQQRALAGRMPGRVEELQRAISKEIEIAVEFEPIVAARRNEIIEDEHPPPIGIGPIGILQFFGADQELGFRKIRQSAGMVEMRMRQDDVLYVGRLITDALDLLVERVGLAPFDWQGLGDLAPISNRVVDDFWIASRRCCVILKETSPTTLAASRLSCRKTWPR